MKRIAFVTDSPEIWGAELSLLDLTSRLDRHGIESVLIAPRSSPIHRQAAGLVQSVPLDLPTHPSAVRGGIRQAKFSDLIREPLTILSSARKLAAMIAGFDAVVSFSLWRNADVILGGSLAKVPVIVDVHETFAGKVGRFISKSTLRWAARVVAPSEYAAVLAGASRKSLYIVPRGVGFEPPSRAPFRVGSFTVGIFGQLQEHKGHALFIEAVKEASKEIPIRALIVGGGTNKATIARVELAVQERPDIFVRQTRVDNPLNLMAQCDAVVNASLHEAFGRTMVEGLSVGAVPLAAGDSGPAEIIRAAGVGLITDRTVASLSRTILDLARQPDVTARARRLGPAIVAERFSLDSVAAEYSRVLLGDG